MSKLIYENKPKESREFSFLDFYEAVRKYEESDYVRNGNLELICAEYRKQNDLGNKELAKYLLDKTEEIRRSGLAQKPIEPQIKKKKRKKRKHKNKKNSGFVFANEKTQKIYEHLLGIRDEAELEPEVVMAIVKRSQEKKWRNASMVKISAIVGDPKYRHKTYRKNNYKPPSAATKHYESINAGGATKIDSSHDPDLYKHTNKSALRLKKDLDEVKKFRGFYGLDH